MNGPGSIFDVFRKTMSLLDKRERRLSFVLMGVMIVVAFAELLGLSTLVLLLRVFSRPDLIETNRYLKLVNDIFQPGSVLAFQVIFSGLVFIVVLVSLGLRALGNYAIIRYSTMRGYTLSSRLLQAYLHQPYTWFLERNSAEVNKSVLSEVQGLVTRILVPGLKLLSSVILAIAIIGFLVVLDPVVALCAAGALGGGYALIYFWLRKRLVIIGQESLEANRERFRLTQEATGGFKEMKLLGLEDAYVARFRRPARRIARNAALNNVFNQMPRIALEALTFLVMVGVILIMLVRQNGDLTAALPLLGVFAFAVIRLLPTLQQVYASLTAMRNGVPVLDHIHEDYTAAMAQAKLRPISDGSTGRMQLDRALELRGVSYAYPSSDRPAVRGIDVTIPARSTIGLVGGTGAGKTTLVDLMLGLLTPDEGDVLIDGIPLDRENMQAWRRTLGYVPQHIYLTDSPVWQNIAFGIPPERVDRAAVERAAKIAALHEFVMSDLPDGYDTIVGERGVRLSGGQRQRIGIARALYADPPLLIMDEATSALDNLTEKAVMDAVQNVRNEKTIIMIAHRLSTVRNCDRILMLDQGRIVSSGTFEELVEGNETFRKMASNE